MAITTSLKTKRIWPRLTDEQKNARRERFVALTNDVEQARTMYFKQDPEYFQETRTVRILKCYVDLNILLLLGLSAGPLASCSSVPSHVLVVDPMHGTALFVSA